MDFDIYMRKARPLLLSQGTMIWYQLLTYVTRFRAVAVFTHPLRISRFILFHKISGRDTNYMWHHIVKTLSRTAAWKEARTGGRRRWKEAPRCHSESIVDFFFFKTQPYSRGKSTVPSCACLVMRVSNQANKYHPNRPTHSQTHAKHALSRHFYYRKQLCLVYLFTLYSPGP